MQIFEDKFTKDSDSEEEIVCGMNKDTKLRKCLSSVL